MSIAFIDLKQQQARIRAKIDAGLRTVLDHGAYIMGPEVGALEARLGEWTGAAVKLGGKRSGVFICPVGDCCQHSELG